MSTSPASSRSGVASVPRISKLCRQSSWILAPARQEMQNACASHHAEDRAGQLVASQLVHFKGLMMRAGRFHSGRATGRLGAQCSHSSMLGSR